MLGSELWEDDFSSLLSIVKEFIVDVLESRKLRLQVNEKFFELKKGHIGIVEKAQETSSDSDMHNTVYLCHCSTS